MRLLAFNYRCAVCNAVTQLPGLSDMAYGEFIMLNDVGNFLYVNAFEDNAFKELKIIFDELEKNNQEINEKNSAEIFQTIFTATCDVPSDGNEFSITKPVICKSCGSKKMASWGPNVSHQFMEVMSPTHEHWSKLTDAEKKKLISDAVADVLKRKDELEIF